MINKFKFTILSCLGAALEYYDFIIYGMMASYLTEVFFASNHHNINFLKVFSVLAIGYLARPLGGLLFGLFSDIYGRKKSLLLVMSVMAVATISIGLLPSYAQAGALSPFLLTICRFMQGLSFGAEIPCITSLIKEQRHNEKIGKYLGWILSSTSLGALLASTTVFMISHFFTHKEIISWVWRVPFMFGAILSIIIFITRTTLPDDSLIHAQNYLMPVKHSNSVKLIKDLFKNHYKNLWIGVFITLFFSYLIIVTLYLPVYLNKQFGFTTQDFFSTMTIGILISGILAPIFGHLSDILPKVKLLRIIPMLFIIFLVIALRYMKSGTYVSLVFFIFGYEIFISMFAANCLTILPELFNTNIRATGIGVCYNLAYSIASLCPLLLSPILETDLHIIAMTIFSICIVFITIAASYNILFKKISYKS